MVRFLFYRREFEKTRQFIYIQLVMYEWVNMNFWG
jgi:hypothetical protein